MKLGTADRLRTHSGREMAPVPRIDLSSNGKLHNSIKRMKEWLIEEARTEAAATHNSYVTTLFQAMRVDNLSMSDVDSLNLYLFNATDGPTSANLLA